MIIKSSKSWTSIIEAMVALFIVMVWVTWLYNIYNKSEKLSTSTDNRIKAIWIAREWIEVLQNIRDTNWILFWADTKNCWNTFNYNINCLWNTSVDNKIQAWSYIIYRDIDNRWKLFSWSVNTDYSDINYRNAYKVNIDNSNWLFTQSWWVSFNPTFTRQVIISYPEDTNWDSLNDSNDEKMLVKSIVSWADNSKNWFYTVNLENLLTNWKRN